MEYYTGDNPIVQVWWRMGLELEWKHLDSLSDGWNDRDFPEREPESFNLYRVKPKEIKSETNT